MPKIKYICPDCGGENVLNDAYAEWDVKKQKWVLQNTFDEFICDDCNAGEITPLEIEVKQRL